MLREKYGPWALVTGASSGIGEHFARQLARAGFNLLLVARREDRLRDLRAELGQRRRREFEPVVADLADPEAVERVVASTTDRDVGLLVSNAGFGLKGGFLSHDRARLEAMLNVNARAPLLLAHALLPRLRKRATGGIILTGSQEGEAPFPWSTAYAATKAFVHSLGMGLYGELVGTGIDVLVLAPGATDTEALGLQGFDAASLPGLMPPSEVARQALRELGRTPFHIPGADNRKLVTRLRRMPRRRQIEFNATNMAAALAASGHPVDTGH
jgi:short-subunit dehydrogenase